ncbi:hypothetical protein IPA_00190 [Ignicoccus pacificus DSM 13166]|uniref:Uncharacterized protein n=1 Tax=Ignicoccus pacificus DSM 13166 TaxID=940294 RepID=A0A977KBC7_9CREN|nr:hypothetical protein IPA_00190 [Ignicoccus pacificus DSM 13166]
MSAELPTKEELLNEIRTKIEAEYSAMKTKLEKRAQEIKQNGKKKVDEVVSKVHFGTK